MVLSICQMSDIFVILTIRLFEDSMNKIFWLPKTLFAEASTHSGISAGVIKAAWDAAGEVIRTWATEGHSIPLPGLGTMRFGEGSGPSPILCARRRKETLARARTIKI